MGKVNETTANVDVFSEGCAVCKMMWMPKSRRSW
jgi:hypothetical protein